MEFTEGKANLKKTILANGQHQMIIRTSAPQTRVNDVNTQVAETRDSETTDIEFPNITSYYIKNGTTYSGEEENLVTNGNNVSRAYYTINIKSIGNFSVPTLVKLCVKLSGPYDVIRVYNEDLSIQLDKIKYDSTSGYYICDVTKAFMDNKSATICFASSSSASTFIYSEYADDDSNYPYAEVTYIPDQAVEEHQQYITGTVGDKVSYSVNVRTGKVRVAVQDIALEGYNLPLDLTHVHMPNYPVSNNIESCGKTYQHLGWKLNYQQYLKLDSNNYVYIDAAGDKHTFVLADNADSVAPLFYDMDKSGLLYDPADSSITDVNGNRLVFVGGCLKHFVDKYNNTLTLNYGTGSNATRVSSITDGMGRTTSFTYTTSGTNRYLSKATRPDGKIITYTKNILGLLSKITYDGKIIEFIYNSNGFITSITCYGQEKVVFDYGDSGQAIGIKNYFVQSGVTTLTHSLSFTRNPYVVAVTNELSTTILYKFDAEGLFVGSAETDGNTRGLISTYCTDNLSHSTAFTQLSNIAQTMLSGNSIVSSGTNITQRELNVTANTYSLRAGIDYVVSAFGHFEGVESFDTATYATLCITLGYMEAPNDYSNILEVYQILVFNPQDGETQFVAKKIRIPKNNYPWYVRIDVTLNNAPNGAQFVYHSVNIQESTNSIEYDCIRGLTESVFGPVCSIWRKPNDSSGSYEHWYHVYRPLRITYTNNNNQTETIEESDYTYFDAYYNQLTRRNYSSTSRYNVWINNGKRLIQNAKATQLIFFAGRTTTVHTHDIGRGGIVHFDSSARDLHYIKHCVYGTNPVIQEFSENQRTKVNNDVTDNPVIQRSITHRNSILDVSMQESYFVQFPPNSQGGNDIYHTTSTYTMHIICRYTYNTYGNVTSIEKEAVETNEIIRQIFQYNNGILLSSSSPSGLTTNVHSFVHQTNTGNVVQDNIPFDANTDTVIITDYETGNNERVDQVKTDIPADLTASGQNTETTASLAYAYSGSNLLSVMRQHTESSVVIDDLAYQYDNDQYGLMSGYKINGTQIRTIDNSFTATGSSSSTIIRGTTLTQSYDRHDRLVETRSGVALNLRCQFAGAPDGSTAVAVNPDAFSADPLRKTRDATTNCNTTYSYDTSGNVTSILTKKSGVDYIAIDSQYDELSQETQRTTVVDGDTITESFTHTSVFAPVVSTTQVDVESTNTQVHQSGMSADQDKLYLVSKRKDVLGRLTSTSTIISDASINKGVGLDQDYVVNTSLPYSTKFQTIELNHADMQPAVYTTLYTEYYKYDKAENITAINTQPNSSPKKLYSYDKLGRLLTECNNDFSMRNNIAYTYDAGGNRRTSTLTTNLGAVTSRKYIYANDWTDKLMQIQETSYGSTTNYNFVYDAYGFPTTYKNNSMSWTRGSLLNVYEKDNRSFVFQYNAYGIRTQKQCGTATTQYKVNQTQLLAEKRTAEGNVTKITYTYANGEIVGLVVDGVSYHYLKNAFGDVVAIYNSDNSLVAQYRYDAWGNVLVLRSNGRPDITASSIGNINPIRYRSYYYDSDIGFYYCQSRYYDPDTGRWISPDSIRYLDTDSLGELNLFAYCGNNPVMGVDPCGTMPNWAKWLIGGVAFAGAIALTLLTGGALMPVVVGMVTSVAISASIQGLVAATEKNDGWDWDAFKQGAVDGAADGAMWGGIFALGGSILRTIKMVRNGVAIGENMTRVTQLAAKGGQITYKGMPGYNVIKAIGGENTARYLSMQHNKAFIERMMRWNISLIDFGIDTIRPYRSFYYLMETIVSSGYAYVTIMY